MFPDDLDPDLDPELEDGEDTEQFADPDEGFDDAGDGDEADGAVDPSGAGDGTRDDDTETPTQVAAPSRGAIRIAALAKEAREARESAERATRELAEFRAERTRNSSAAERESEARRLEMMSPDERMEHRLTQIETNSSQRLARMEFNSADANDKAAFTGSFSAKPQLAALADAVEERLTTMRAQGVNAPRLTVATYLIGEQALKAAPRANARAGRTAEANRARQTTRPGTSRGDVASGSRRGQSDAAAREARLLDVPL